MSDRHDRIAAAVQEYDLQGWHRTGTAVDQASGEWLAAKLRDAGLEPVLEPYTLDRIEVETARVDVGGISIPALPAFDGGDTQPAGISGRVGPLGSQADIGVTSFAGEEAGAALDAARRGGGHKAIVAVTEGRRSGLQARNATHFKQPFGPPVLYVSSEHKQQLAQLAAGESSGTAVAHLRRVAAQSANVVAIRRGSAAGVAPVVVTTPRSGWWHCASERGGGIAAWLEVARAVAAAPVERDVWFVAFSGHELGHYGLDAFLERHPGMVEEVKVWVHFGANVGGATESSTRVGASNAELLAAAVGALNQAGVAGATTAPAGRVPGLEAGAINALGGRCISLLGGNGFFHLEQDRWPDVVDVESIARQAEAFSGLVLDLAKGSE